MHMQSYYIACSSPSMLSIYIRFTKDDEHEESWTKKWRSTGIFTFMFWEVLRNSSTTIVFLHQLYLWLMVCQCHNQLFDSHHGLCCCTSVQYGMHGVMVVQEELFTSFIPFCGDAIHGLVYMIPPLIRMLCAISLFPQRGVITIVYGYMWGAQVKYRSPHFQPS